MHIFTCLFCSEYKTKHDSLIRTSTLVYKRSEFATPNFTPESEKWYVVLLLFVIFCIFLLFYLNYVFILYIIMWMWFVFSPGFKSMWHVLCYIFVMLKKNEQHLLLPFNKLNIPFFVSVKERLPNNVSFLFSMRCVRCYVISYACVYTVLKMCRYHY